MNAMDIAIQSAMLADTGSGGLNEPDVGAIGGFHQLVAPQNSAFPRVHFQMLDDQPLYSFTSNVADHLFYQVVAHAVDDPINGGREGVQTSGRLAERARALFTDPAGVSVSGKTLLYSRFMNSIPPDAVKDENLDRYVYSKGMVLEIWLA